MSLIKETAAEMGGMRLWETSNADFRMLDGLDETVAWPVKDDGDTRLKID